MEILPYMETALLVLSSGIAAFGYGSALSSILRIEPNVGDCGILGLFSFGFLGCLFHFVIPLTPALQLAILALGIGIAAVVAIRGKEFKQSKVFLTAAGAICLAAITARQATLGYDAGLYYLQAMRWIREQPIVPGLVNLHGRLGFNSMVFLIAGVADRSEIGWISNFLVVVFVLLSLHTRLRAMTAGARRSRVAFWFLFLSIVSLLDYHWYGVLIADSFAAVLIIYWACLALGLHESGDPATDIALSVLSAVLALVVKISAAPLLLPTAALAWLYRKHLAAFCWRGAAVSGLLIVAWTLRGYTISGCAIYPVSQTCISAIPWGASEHEISTESLAIRSWARQPGTLNFVQVLSGRAWVLPWLKAMLRNRSILLFLVCVPFGLLAVLWSGNLRRPSPDLLVVAAGLAGGLAFWFVTAPTPRFGWGFIVSAALLSASVGFAVCFGRPRFAVYVPALLVALMALLGIRVFWRARSDYFYSISEAAMIQLQEASGHRIFVPKVSDQCWNHELPCTPYFDPAALIKVRWPANWSVAPPGWTPDKGVVVVGGVDGTLLRP